MLKLNRKQYNAKMQIYFQDKLNLRLAEEIIHYVWLNTGMQQTSEDFELIQDTKANVYRMKFDNQIYYVKSYAYRNMTKILKNFFRPVEAVKCYKTGIKLIDADIAIAKPVLALTWKRNFFITDSIFVTKEVPGVTLHTYMFKKDKCSDMKLLRKQIIKKMAMISSKLVNHNLVHLDPWLGNFMVYDKQGDIHIKLIDIDNIYALPFLPFKMLLTKNLVRLRRKLLFFLNKDEINVFLEEFMKNSSKKLNIDVLRKICF